MSAPRIYDGDPAEMICAIADYIDSYRACEFQSAGLQGAVLAAFPSASSDDYAAALVSANKRASTLYSGRVS